MNHNIKITLLIISMFIVTQLIALYVVNFYSPIVVVNNVQTNVVNPNKLPLGLEPPPMNQQIGTWQTLIYIVPSFIIAILLFFMLTRLKAEVILKGWFFIVVAIALSVSLIPFLPKLNYAWAVALFIAFFLTFFKVYRRNLFVHNLTELLIYPGIAAIFVAILSIPERPNSGVYSVVVLLVLISVYDIWAVWHSGIMQKMAKYQINKLKIFSGFFVPYASKAVREKMKRMKRLGKRNSKVKVNVALLGGGDVVFPAITAGVVLRRFGFEKISGLSIPLASIIVITGATLGLGFLLFFSKKKKFYPAMPFISAGIFVTLGLCYLLF